MKCFNSTDAASLQDDLSSLSKWPKDWCISFNKRCHLIRFNIKSLLYFNYLIVDRVITNKSSIKYLGVLISSDLTWNQHILFINGSHTGLWPSSIVLLALATLLVQRKNYITLIKSIKNIMHLSGPLIKKENVVFSEKVQRKAT